MVLSESTSMFYDKGEISRYGDGGELVDANRTRILDVMKNGDAYTYNDYNDLAMLVKLNDRLHFSDARRREAVDKKIGRFMGVDVKSGRMLAFGEDCRVLSWMPMGGEENEMIEEREVGWAWQWRNKMGAPRFNGAWGLTSAAAESVEKVKTLRDEETKRRGDIPQLDTEYRDADMASFRKWDGEEWREMTGAFFGSAVWEDQTGGIWLFRVREVEIIHRGGRRQWLPMDAGMMWQYRLEMESERKGAAAWVVSSETLRRYELVAGGDGQENWHETNRLRLPRFGMQFAGPWIVGERMYWVQAGTLCCEHLDVLKKSGRVN